MREERSGWGIVEPLVGWVLGTIAAGIGAAVAAVATGASLSKTTLPIVVGGLVGMWSAYLAVIFLTSRARGSGNVVRDVGLRFEGWQDVAGGVLAAVLTSFLLVNAVYVLLQLTNVVDKSDLNRLDAPARELGDLAHGPSFVVLALFVGIGAPLVEEIFFRGFLQPAIIRRVGPIPGVIITAAFFAAAHLQPLQFPALLVFGLVVGTLAYRTKRLGPGIAAHITFNGLTLLLLALQ